MFFLHHIKLKSYGTIQSVYCCLLLLLSLLFYGFVCKEPWVKRKFKIKSKAWTARGPVSSRIYQMSPWSAWHWNVGLRLTIAETEKLSHVGLQWIQMISDQVVTWKQQRKSWVDQMSQWPVAEKSNCWGGLSTWLPFWRWQVWWTAVQ